jgi:acetyl esterase
MPISMRAVLIALLLSLLTGCGVPASHADDPARTVRVGPHRLAVDIYEPAATAAKTGRRAVLMVHGGGWVEGDRSELRDLARLAVSEGVVALSMDYRLTSQSGVHWPMPAEDVATVLAWMRTHANELGIDPQRIALLGGSAGGHLVAWIARDPDPDNRPNRLIVLWGPWDLVRLPEHAPEWVGPVVAKLLNGQSARDASPLEHLVRGMPPTLIVHGVDDPIVSIDQSRRACAALRASDNICTLVELPHQGHVPEDAAEVRRTLDAVRGSLAAL